MRIMHNLMAMNANRSRKKNTNGLSKNLEKLSSGYQINRAADDAAGLAISEKMRSQITGMNAASKNASDGISLVQTAEGAMQEIHTMLSRMGQLATQAANGTYSQTEREAMQQEIDELQKEISRIRDSTKFSQIPLLQGNEGIKNPPDIKGGLPNWVTVSSSPISAQYPYYFNRDGGGTYTFNLTHQTTFIDFAHLNSSNIQDLLQENTGFYVSCDVDNSYCSIQFTTGTSASVEQSGTNYIYKIGIDGVTDGVSLVNRILVGTNGNRGSLGNGHIKLCRPNYGPEAIQIYDNRAIGTLPTHGTNAGALLGNPYPLGAPIPKPWSLAGWSGPGSGETLASSNDASLIYGGGIAYKSNTAHDGLTLQIGPSATETLPIDLPNMSLDKIGVNALSILTVDSANAAIDKVRSGVDYVSKERARMGSYQNRLEHTLNNLAVTKENLTNAESRIRDTDMAEEMMDYTKNNILNQAAQAMLSQANTVPQGILQLLQ